MVLPALLNVTPTKLLLQGNRLNDSPGRYVDQVQGIGIEVAPGSDCESLSVRAQRHAQRPIVHLYVRPRGTQQLSCWNDEYCHRVAFQ